MITDKSSKDKKKKPSTALMSPEEMYRTVKKDNTFGIEGYEVPRSTTIFISGRKSSDVRAY